MSRSQVDILSLIGDESLGSAAPTTGCIAAIVVELSRFYMLYVREWSGRPDVDVTPSVELNTKNLRLLYRRELVSAFRYSAV